MEQQHAQIALLRRSILDDIFKDLDSSFARRWLRRFLEPIAWPSANRFAEIASRFDQYVMRSGFRDAMSQILPNFVSGFEVCGDNRIPEDGPLLVVSNHPGTYDSLVIAAALPRNDLNIIASGFPVLRRLPSASKHLIFASEDIHERMAVVRSAIRHLRDGGSLLIFPGGRVEPDPAVLPGAEESMSVWSPSLEVFLSRVPQTRVLVTIVSGVLAPNFLNSPLIRLWRGMRDPQTVAEVIQVVTQMLFPKRIQLKPKITFGLPMTLDELHKWGGSQGIIGSIIGRAKQLLEEHDLWIRDEPCRS